eukprot:scaffold122709_cov36-Prasinocladus_malaysianus.AAC.3
MGCCFSATVTPKHTYQVLLVGLDGAGKTTVLRQLCCSQPTSNPPRLPDQPTIGFNMETVRHTSTTSLTIWDLGGCEKIRPLWRKFCCRGISAVVYVVDACDGKRLAEARKELHKLMANDALGPRIPLLVLANYNYRVGASEISLADLEDELDLHCLETPTWYVQGCHALDGAGLVDGLDWLTVALSNNLVV